jgi:hypothetical protein
MNGKINKVYFSTFARVTRTEEVKLPFFTRDSPRWPGNEPK